MGTLRGRSVGTTEAVVSSIGKCEGLEGWKPWADPVVDQMTKRGSQQQSLFSDNGLDCVLLVKGTGGRMTCTSIRVTLGHFRGFPVCNLNGQGLARVGQWTVASQSHTKEGSGSGYGVERVVQEAGLPRSGREAVRGDEESNMTGSVPPWQWRKQSSSGSRGHSCPCLGVCVCAAHAWSRNAYGPV